MLPGTTKGKTLSGEPLKVSLDFPLHDKQLLALNSPSTEMVYGGAAGPGKSHLLRVAFIIWAIEIPGLQLYLFRRQYRDLIQGHMQGPTGFKAMLQPLVECGMCEVVELEIRFKNGINNSYVGGSRISLNHCLYDDDVFNYKTIEFHVLGLEEATEFSPFQIKFLRSRVRMPDVVKIPDKYLMPKEHWRSPDKPRHSFPRCIYPTNPGGPSHEYIRRGWIDGHEPYELWEAPEDEGGKLRQFIPGLLTDNPSVNPEEYAATLSGLPPAYRDALLHGKWTAAVGSFFPEFDPDQHVITDFTPPDHWFRFRGFDWGTAEPFCVHWTAVSDGEPFRDDQGQERWFPRGAFIIYREWYGCEKQDSSKGLRLRNEDIATGIRERSELNGKNVITLTDSLPFQDRGGEGIHTVFARNGCQLTKGDTSRVAGWSQMRSRLIGKEIDSNSGRIPMLFLTASCKYARMYIPMLTYHPSESKPEDAQEHGEATHACDTIRLICMAHTVIKDRLEPIQARIEREIKASVPTMKKIVTNQGYNHFR